MEEDKVRTLLPMTLLLVILTVLMYGALDMTDVSQARNFRAVQMGINYPSQAQSAHYVPMCTPVRMEVGSSLCDTPTPGIQEDDTLHWECATMGNKLCAWEVVRRYPV